MRYAVGHDVGFFVFIVCLHYLYAFAVGIVGEYLFRYLLAVCGNKSVCRSYDIACGTVIFLKLERPLGREYLFEIEDIAYVGSSE